MREHTPTDPIRTASDLHEHWRSVMKPLGFSRRYLYFAFIDRERHMVPQLHEISDFPSGPEPWEIDQLMSIFQHFTSVDDPEFTVALLIARPGSTSMDRTDRVLARMLLSAGERAGVPLEPIHLATDLELRPFTGNDLVA